ncbi:sensor histidine kinase [uncultured Modestobacter sp.]|uniref:sensor histidine kinase n=1 Tax=uncultured Modestobacter sp. TaxID=380048 RepID=UPI00260D321E|nr:histidine kinase [uncultured Modestobacter sp.]
MVIASLTVIATSGMDGWQQTVFLALAVAAGAATLVRHRWPHALVVVAWTTTAFATQVLLIPALFNLGVRRRHRGDLVVLVATVLLLAAVAPRGERLVSIDGVDLESWMSLGSWVLNGIVVVIVPYLIGTAIGVRRDLVESYRLRAEHAEAERTARAAEAVLLERARIAREAHDVLGHKLSLLTMQAGGLELNAGADAEVVEKQARLIRQSARDALQDLRFIIGSIETPDPLAPGYGDRSLTPEDLCGIHKLVGESVSSGAIVDLAESNLRHPEQLPQDISRAAYRVVQEGLTNAHRHAPGAPVIVSLSGAPGEQFVVEVRNTVTVPEGKDHAEHSGGRGIPGLEERARVVGGELTVTEADSVFIVRARLPWQDTHAQRTERRP